MQYSSSEHAENRFSSFTRSYYNFCCPGKALSKVCACVFEAYKFRLKVEVRLLMCKVGLPLYKHCKNG